MITGVNAPFLAQNQSHGNLPRRRDGRLKQRLTWDEKFLVLDPTSTIELTKRRIEWFQELFAFRRTRAIITRAHGNSRDWVEMRGWLDCNHIARHLLADRIPHLLPQWVGARSFETSLFFCLDVDADRGSVSTGTPCSRQRRRTFDQRCQWVENCLSRLGIDARNPAEVLIQESPSRGRHYYVFFARTYRLDEYRHLLKMSGLSFAKGQVEFFPSEMQGLRLPFGLVPGRPHDPNAWIRFIEDYRRGRIKRHTIKQLTDRLTRNGTPSPPASPPTTTHTNDFSRAYRGGVPRHRTAATQPPVREANTPSAQPAPTTIAEVQDLLERGIEVRGTRTAILKHLAAHLIFIQGKNAQEAAQELIAWAMHPRHNSHEIQDDLASGTSIVPQHITRMCQWYEKHRDGDRQRTAKQPPSPGFTPAEVGFLGKRLSEVPEQERPAMADFLLHFLTFAKRFGKPAKDGSGWEATPAVNSVVRKWPGCHHMNYKAPIEVATKLGLLTMTKGAWHNPQGKGRARTYRLAVPIVAGEHQVLTYDEAKSALIAAPLDHPGRRSDSREIPADNQDIRFDNHDIGRTPPNQESPDAPATTRCCSSNRGRLKRNRHRFYTPALHPGRTRTAVDSRPRKRPAWPYAAKGLRHPAAGTVQPGTPMSAGARAKGHELPDKPYRLTGLLLTTGPCLPILRFAAASARGPPRVLPD